MNRQCPDCAVLEGAFHIPGCDVERCRLCGHQAIGCGCVEARGVDEGGDPVKEAWIEYDAEVTAKGGRLPWTGRWPGEENAESLDLWVYWDETNTRWVKCTKDHPDARPDLNSLSLWSGFVWDVATGRWMKPLRVQKGMK